MGKATRAATQHGPKKTTAPIAILPVELLEAVFLISGPLPALRVCSHWRAVASSSPRLWQSLTLDAQLPILVNRARALEFMGRSYPLPFDVHLNLAPERASDLVLPLLAPVLHTKRLRSCTINGKREDIARFNLPGSTIGGPLVLLEIRLTTDEPSSVPPEGTLPTLSLCLPTLPERHLILDPLPFTNLFITECFLDVSVGCSQLLQFLTTLPHLSSLQFRGTAHDDESDDPVPSLISLPHLISLRLYNTYFTRAILSSIDAPALETLHLEHLNVEFMPGEDEEDEDPENDEFSLSPASDRALGMGMRSLIERSNPPIKTFILDYADMRTKDFAWCFGRLDKLEVLKLVASDLSDTVISLLRPMFAESSHASFVTWSDENEEDAFSDDSTFWGSDDELEEDEPMSSEAESDDEERWGADEDSLVDVGGPSAGGDPMLRLPSLTTLEIIQCPRWTTEILIDTLVSRVIYTDAQKTGCATLTGLVLVECEQFELRHGQELSRTLGSRLRASYL